MFCTSCQQEIPEGLRFCPNCEKPPFRFPFKIASIVLLLLLVIVGLPFWLHGRARAIQRAHFRQILENAELQDNRASDDYDSYISSLSDASDASQKRADNANSDSPDEDYIKQQAKTEEHDVEEAMIERSSVSTDLRALTDSYSSALGDNAVSDLRENLKDWDADSEVQLADWSRAATEIADGSGFDVESLYQASDDAEAKADADFRQITSLKHSLNARLQQLVQNR
jgi:hypothetical protein